MRTLAFSCVLLCFLLVGVWGASNEVKKVRAPRRKLGPAQDVGSSQSPQPAFSSPMKRTFPQISTQEKLSDEDDLLPRKSPKKSINSSPSKQYVQQAGTLKAARRLDFDTPAVSVLLTPILASAPLKTYQTVHPTREEISSAKLSDFTLKTPMGAGFFGKVVRCWFKAESDAPNKREWAMKIIPLARLVKTSCTDLLLEEVRNSLQIDSPSVVRLYRAFLDSSSVYLWMECMPRGDLNRPLASIVEEMDEGFDGPTLRHLSMQMVLGVEATHRAGIIHRDIKPENFMLTQEGRVKLADFGLSVKATSSRDDAGTIQYQAPEIINRQEYTDKVDIWALGVTFYQMAVGLNPFHAPTEELSRELIIGFESETGITSSGALNQMPEPFHNLLIDMLRQDPTKRPTMAQVLQHEWFSGMNSHDIVSSVAPDFPPALTDAVKRDIHDSFGAYKNSVESDAMTVKPNALALCQQTLKKSCLFQ